MVLGSLGSGPGGETIYREYLEHQVRAQVAELVGYISSGRLDTKRRGEARGLADRQRALDRGAWAVDRHGACTVEDRVIQCQRWAGLAFECEVSSGGYRYPDRCAFRDHLGSLPVLRPTRGVGWHSTARRDPGGLVAIGVSPASQYGIGTALPHALRAAKTGSPFRGPGCSFSTHVVPISEVISLWDPSAIRRSDSGKVEAFSVVFWNVKRLGNSFISHLLNIWPINSSETKAQATELLRTVYCHVPESTTTPPAQTTNCTNCGPRADVDNGSNSERPRKGALLESLVCVFSKARQPDTAYQLPEPASQATQLAALDAITMAPIRPSHLRI
ncbi:hypothetical protein EDB89DRAFT_1904404 [Lactarius sanguifluus]|nr:hypothetical protein EDB89DRAFT_1904404 [Lactarius sanguifluus]